MKNIALLISTFFLFNINFSFAQIAGNIEDRLEESLITEYFPNYSKIKKGYNFNSDGPEDSYMDSSDEYNMELGYELGEQEGTESGESDDGAGAGTASVGVWDSGIARGVANQVANTKWGDSYQTTRGKGNPLW